VITSDFALYECFRRKLLNYHAVAANIKAEVERQAGRTTTINTIVVAMARFNDSAAKPGREKPLSVLKGARISLATDVVDVSIRASKSDLYVIAKRIGELSESLNEPIRIFQLSRSIELIVDDRDYQSMIKSSLEGTAITKETMELSRLDIQLTPPVDMASEFGLFLTELLYRHGINIRQTYIGEETVLILERSDGPRAFEIIQAEIDKSRAAADDGSKMVAAPSRSPKPR
jgi:hypothetical protein